MKAIAKLWTASAPLTAVGLLMLPALLGALAGLWLDPRTITGAPAWLKPAKFAASIAVYSLTLAWVFTYLPQRRRMRRIVGWTTAIAMLLEIAIIDVQAWRGVASHFNVSTPLDGVLFTIMGLAIVVQTLTSISVAIALWREPFTDDALGWALRFGMTLTIVGALAGGLMTRPTTEQLDQVRATHRMPLAGAHTVGAADGGPGLPGTGWSTKHGDLRVAHFAGLHAIQVLMLFAFVLPRWWSARLRSRVIALMSASYAAFFGILIWQALRGQSLTAPDALTLVVLAVWAALTAFDVLNVLRRERHARRVDDAVDLLGTTRADNRARHRWVA
jgi:hypothetical protein